MPSELPASPRDRRAPLVVAGVVGAVLVLLGAYLVAAGWPSRVGYRQGEWFAYGTGSMVGIAVEGPSAGFVIGIVLVALGTGTIGAVAGWALGRHPGARRAVVQVGRATSALWRRHRVLVVVAVVGALLAALGALLLSGAASATSTASTSRLVVTTSPMGPASWSDEDDGYDDGYGYGDGYGYDDGYGYGDGYGYDDGYGYGDGYLYDDGWYDQGAQQPVEQVGDELATARFESVDTGAMAGGEQAAAPDERVAGMLLGGLGLVLLGGVGGWALAPRRG
ncbi:MAG: hypothetical protein NVV66_09490 [Cellulomonas sp.]|uniref:hypothetical protein n=1 Tax=Cellulomonas sp. TaxID=40001 RepID=UPI0025901639|nr:hypothetical protein [Cellulomonas sp.]MCR6704905.1 hypothetical protein [Cellulomonas sp.]